MLLCLLSHLSFLSDVPFLFFAEDLLYGRAARRPSSETKKRLVCDGRAAAFLAALCQHRSSQRGHANEPRTRTVEAALARRERPAFAARANVDETFRDLLRRATPVSTMIKLAAMKVHDLRKIKGMLSVQGQKQQAGVMHANNKVHAAFKIQIEKTSPPAIISIADGQPHAHAGRSKQARGMRGRRARTTRSTTIQERCFGARRHKPSLDRDNSHPNMLLRLLRSAREPRVGEPARAHFSSEDGGFERAQQALERVQQAC